MDDLTTPARPTSDLQERERARLLGPDLTDAVRFTNHVAEETWPLCERYLAAEGKHGLGGNPAERRLLARSMMAFLLGLHRAGRTSRPTKERTP